MYFHKILFYFLTMFRDLEIPFQNDFEKETPGLETFCGKFCGNTFSMREVVAERKTVGRIMRPYATYQLQQIIGVRHIILLFDYNAKLLHNMGLLYYCFNCVCLRIKLMFIKKKKCCQLSIFDIMKQYHLIFSKIMEVKHFPILVCGGCIEILGQIATIQLYCSGGFYPLINCRVPMLAKDLNLLCFNIFFFNHIIC